MTPVVDNNNVHVPDDKLHVMNVIPNRIFVGSLQMEVNEDILKKVFDSEGVIRDVKIIREAGGQSKGYGFVTFVDDQAVSRVLAKAPGSYCYNGRQWNVSQAIRRFVNYHDLHVPPANMVYYQPFSPHGFSNGLYFGPQQVYGSPSPFLPSPMMHQPQFIFPTVGSEHSDDVRQMTAEPHLIMEAAPMQT